MRRIIAAFSLTALIACSDAPPGTAGGAVDTGSIDSGTLDTASAAGTGAAAGAAVAADAAQRPRSVVFLGTSLTAGLGVGPDVAYPALIEQRITEAHLPFTVTNAGISGETSAGGVRRIEWLLQTPVDVLVLELGANDGLRALNIDSMRHNIDVVLQRTRAKYPDAEIVILGMEAPPNLGNEYTSHFHEVFPALARKYHADLVPFLLAGVAGVRGLNQEDGMHPNPDGHRILADNVWKVLQPILVRRARAPS